MLFRPESCRCILRENGPIQVGATATAAHVEDCAVTYRRLCGAFICVSIIGAVPLLSQELWKTNSSDGVHISARMPVDYTSWDSATVRVEIVNADVHACEMNDFSSKLKGVRVFVSDEYGIPVDTTVRGNAYMTHPEELSPAKGSYRGCGVIERGATTTVAIALSEYYVKPSGSGVAVRVTFDSDIRNPRKREVAEDIVRADMMRHGASSGYVSGWSDYYKALGPIVTNRHVSVEGHYQLMR